MKNLFQELILPNGTAIKNRIAKAAMEENMADELHAPSDEIIKLYNSWAEGGVGLIITGNVMLDKRAMTGPGGIVLENDRLIERFKKWAAAGQKNGAKVWLQINHPGRQVPVDLGQETWAPSVVQMNMGKYSKMFPIPKEMDEEKIKDVIYRFAMTSQLAEQAGFSGVQIHAAHGYLLSQFLSPLTNRRTDKWGGSLENRARILIETVKAVRAVVSPNFSVGVKLNSADFQRGGFEPKDAKAVIEMLNSLPVDLVELSGGSYEAPAMQGQTKDGRTLAREAYFLEFAKEMVETAKMPLMITGGINKKEVAELAIVNGISMVGIATALAVNPELSNEWKRNQVNLSTIPAIGWENKAMASAATMAVVRYQLRRLGAGKNLIPMSRP